MKLDFTKNDGLIPAIIQDVDTDKVLMLGYMNLEAFDQTNKSNKVTFFSRSRNCLWTKGETSGNFLNVHEIMVDCDKDTILVKASPTGPVCHTGADTCFNELNNKEDFVQYLSKLIAGRKSDPQDDSYTSSLFKKGINKIAQKVGEEAVELVIEAKDDNRELFLNEGADLFFHYLVLLEAKGYSFNDIIDILKERHK